MNDITALAQKIKASAIAVARDGRTDDEWFYYLQCVHHKNVLALVEALEKAQRHEQEWKSLCEAAAVDLDDWREIDDKSRGLVCKMADSIIALNERIAELESRTVTVKLPAHDRFFDYAEMALIYRDEQWQRTLTAAGIQVIEGDA